MDISKAFDTLSWPFLLDVMQALGFGNTLAQMDYSIAVHGIFAHPPKRPARKADHPQARRQTG
jgi:hypothetical protein